MPTCPDPQLLAGSPTMPPLPALPWRLGARGWMTRDSQSWAGPRKSHLNNLGVGGRGQMKRTEKGKKNPDERTAHINLLVPQSQKQGHGSCSPLQSVGAGRWARRARGGHSDSTHVREPASHHGGGGAADPEAEPSLAAPGS